MALSPIATYGRATTERLANLAVDIALSGPIRFSPIAPTCKVRASYVREVRVLLAEHGVDVDLIVRERLAREREAKERARLDRRFLFGSRKEW